MRQWLPISSEAAARLLAPGLRRPFLHHSALPRVAASTRFRHASAAAFIRARALRWLAMPGAAMRANAFSKSSPWHALETSSAWPGSRAAPLHDGGLGRTIGDCNKGIELQPAFSGQSPDEFVPCPAAGPGGARRCSRAGAPARRRKVLHAGRWSFIADLLSLDC